LVLDELRRLDPVAALRFASVYKAFEDPEDFEREIQLLSGNDDLVRGGVGCCGWRMGV
jgi:transcriptional repressor NrdR